MAHRLSGVSRVLRSDGKALSTISCECGKSWEDKDAVEVLKQAHRHDSHTPKVEERDAPAVQTLDDA